MATKPVTIWWMRGEDESDLHGFVTREHRDAYDRGEPGPFLRIVRNHHELGPVPEEVIATRRYLDRNR